MASWRWTFVAMLLIGMATMVWPGSSFGQDRSPRHVIQPRSNEYADLRLVGHHPPGHVKHPYRSRHYYGKPLAHKKQYQYSYRPRRHISHYHYYYPYPFRHHDRCYRHDDCGSYVMIGVPGLHIQVGF